jgi:hypothetical protein
MATALFVDDSVTTCDCCSRRDLKATVCLRLDDGRIVYYGRTCAARNTGKDWPQIVEGIRAERDRRHGLATNELLRMRRAGANITAMVVREVATEYGADPSLVARQWF